MVHEVLMRITDGITKAHEYSQVSHLPFPMDCTFLAASARLGVQSCHCTSALSSWEDTVRADFPPSALTYIHVTLYDGHSLIWFGFHHPKLIDLKQS